MHEYGGGILYALKLKHSSIG